MNNQEVIDILQVERQCVERANNGQCNKECSKCDLCENAGRILEAYDIALSQLRHNETQRLYNRNCWNGLAFFFLALIPCTAFIASMVYLVTTKHYVFASLSFIMALFTVPQYHHKS